MSEAAMNHTFFITTYCSWSYTENNGKYCHKLLTKGLQILLSYFTVNSMKFGKCCCCDHKCLRNQSISVKAINMRYISSAYFICMCFTGKLLAVVHAAVAGLHQLAPVACGASTQKTHQASKCKCS